MSSNAARQGGFGRWIVIALGGVVFAVIAAVIWYAYVEVMGLGTGGPPPLVRAAAGPIKRAPDDPGGMEIPHRGSAVARVFDETVDGVRRERILPRQDTAQVPAEPEPASPPAQQATPGPTTPGSQAAEPATAPPVERLAAREPEPSAPLAPTQPATRPSITVTNQPPPPQAQAPTAQQAAPRPSTPPPAAAGGSDARWSSRAAIRSCASAAARS